MAETARRTGSSFWDDLNRHMEDPEFERSFVETSLRIQAVDSLMNKIDERREALKMSKEDLAKITGHTGSSIRRLFSKRHANPTLDTYVMLAYAVGLELTLVEVDESAKEEPSAKSSANPPPRPLHAN